MSVTQIYQTGAEWGTATMELSSVTGSGFTASTVDKKTGSYAFRTENYDYGTIDLTTQYNVDYTVPGSLTQCRVGFWCKNPGATAGTSPRLLTIAGSGTDGLIIRWDVTNTELECYDSNGGAVRDSAVSATFAGGSWVHIGVDVKVAASGGWIYLYVNGSEVLNYSGATTTAISAIEQVHFGGVQTTGNNWSQYLYFDDIFVWDTSGEVLASPAPRYQLKLATPDGEGLFSEWNGSDGDIVDNYLMVDDVPSDSGSTNVNITEAFVGNRETVTLTNTDITGFTVAGIYPHGIMKRGTAAAASLEAEIYVRDDSTGDFGYSLNMPVGLSYQFVFDEWLVHFDAAAWEQADINNLVVGVVAD